jgi:hypothetical protein
MLPLVVLAMVAFTYIFVRELPTAATTSTLPPENGGTTAPTTDTTDPSGTTTSTTFAADAQAYVDSLNGQLLTLKELQSQLAAANTGFDADPRTVSYEQAQAAFEAVLAGTTTLASEVEALTPPAGFEDAHAAVVGAAQQAVTAADAALAGLNAPSPDTGDDRRAAVAAFDAAVVAFETAVEGVVVLASQT